VDLRATPLADARPPGPSEQDLAEWAEFCHSTGLMLGPEDYGNDLELMEEFEAQRSAVRAPHRDTA
jgi:hypothetical protein